jgi:hypothetical protein
MPLYYSLSGETTDGRRTAEGLVRLKDAFDKEKLPRRTADHTLMLATWNIREFDSAKYGRRDREPIFYAAEIISHFDLVAVQEVHADLTALNTLMKYLGNWWKYVLTDVTEGTMGNRERMAFVYDSRKINFGGLASEVVIPPVRRKGQKTLEPAEQLARTPFWSASASAGSSSPSARRTSSTAKPSRTNPNASARSKPSPTSSPRAPARNTRGRRT